MGDNTGIEWADATHNFLYGCDPRSPGCKNCYARFSVRRQDKRMPGLTVMDDRRGLVWTGKIFFAEHRLDQPVRWGRGRKVFVNSLSDLFHRNVTDEWIEAGFGVYAGSPRHTAQILTKREDRMVEWYDKMGGMKDPAMHCISTAAEILAKHYDTSVAKQMGRMTPTSVWPLPNVWMGVSVEDQMFADIRIPALKKVPAVVHFLSMEPLIGEVNSLDFDGIEWVIVGGESGPGARPMKPEWARYIRDAALSSGTPLFMKQWGNHDSAGLHHVSKKETGCEIDGVNFKQWPEAA
jgi:protein gp37